MSWSFGWKAKKCLKNILQHVTLPPFPRWVVCFTCSFQLDFCQMIKFDTNEILEIWKYLADHNNFSLDPWTSLSGNNLEEDKERPFIKLSKCKEPWDLSFNAKFCGPWTMKYHSNIISNLCRIKSIIYIYGKQNKCNHTEFTLPKDPGSPNHRDLEGVLGLATFSFKAFMVWL